MPFLRLSFSFSGEGRDGFQEASSFSSTSGHNEASLEGELVLCLEAFRVDGSSCSRHLC